MEINFGKHNNTRLGNLSNELQSDEDEKEE